MKALKYILVFLVIAGVISLLYYQGMVTGELTTGYLVKGLLILAGLVVTLFRGSHRNQVTRLGLKTAYSHIIGNAFSEDPKLEKKFYAALSDFNKRKYDAALKKLDSLRIEAPRSADRFAVLTFTALCHSRQGRWEDAIKEYIAALQIQEHSTAASNLGNCYLNLGRTEEALDAFLRAIRADDSNANAYNNIAQLYIQLGEYEDAMEYAEAALERNANMPQALNAMAICHAMFDEDDESERYIRRAAANGSDIKTLRSYIANLKS